MDIRQAVGWQDSRKERAKRLAESAVDESADQARVVQNNSPSRWTATPPLAVSEAESVVKRHRSKESSLTLKQEDFWRSSSGPVRKMSNDVLTPEKGASYSQELKIVDKIQDRPPLKPKTRVQWKGKTCWIRLPRDWPATQPLSSSEVTSRVEGFKCAGYDTRGFDHCRGVDGEESSERGVHSRCIFPDPDEQPEERQEGNFRIRIPDQRNWDAYVNLLTEQKLRALGVSKDGEGQKSPLSRQTSSGQLPLPLVSSAATLANGSQCGQRGSVVVNPLALVSSAHHTYNRSVTSPVLPLGNTLIPLASLAQQKPAVPAILAAWSPQYLNQQDALHGGSLAIAANRSNSVESLSPVSPYSYQHSQQLPLSQNDELLAQMQQQRHRQFQFQVLQQQQLQPVGLRQGSVLAEVPEEDEDDAVNGNAPGEQDKGRLKRGVPLPDGKISHNVSTSCERDLHSAEYHLEKAIDKQFDVDDGSDSGSRRHGRAGPCHSSDSAIAKVHAALWGGHQLEPQLYHPQPHTKAHSLANAPYSSGEDYINDTHRSLRNGSEVTTNPSDMDTNPSLDEHGNRYVPRRSTNYKPDMYHTSRPSVSKLNVDAKEFRFDSSVSSQPASFSSTGLTNRPEHMNTFTPAGLFDMMHQSYTSRGSVDGTKLNMSIVAPSFVPDANARPSFPHGNFNFMIQPPSLAAGLHPIPFADPYISAANAGLSVGLQMPEASERVFSHVDFRDIVKPPRGSKAVPIVRPNSTSSTEDDDETEDEDGRIIRSSSRQKRARRADTDGDEVPRFAVPHPPIGRSQNETSEPPRDRSHESIVQGAKRSVGSTQEMARTTSAIMENSLHPSQSTAPPLQMPAAAFDRAAEGAVSAAAREAAVHKHASSGSLFAAARPNAEKRSSFGSHVTQPSTDYEETERSQHEKRTVSPPYPTHNYVTAFRCSDDGSYRTAPEGKPHLPYPDSEGVDYDPLAQPSFKEIDEVIKHLNEEGSDFGVERDENPWMLPSPGKLPLHETGHEDLRSGLPYRSDAQDLTDRRHTVRPIGLDPGSTSITQNPFSDEHAGLAYESPERPLNESGEIAASDWDNGTPSRDENKAKPHRVFHINCTDDRIDGLLQSRLDPVEKSLQSIQLALAAIHYRESSSKSRRSLSGRVVSSDADDEDDETAADTQYRNRSPAKDRKVERIRHLIIEALGDVKNSIPRLEVSHKHLEDIRGVIEEALARQRLDVAQRRDQVGAEDVVHPSDLMKIVQDTNARVLEATEYRRIAEKREADAQKLLKLSEEEIALLQESSQEDTQKLRTLEMEREDLQARTASAEGAQEELRQRLTALTAANDALESTLDEYRISSTKWREEVDKAKVETEILENRASGLKLQIAEVIRVREAMRERLGKLQTDLSTATAQLANEKAKWHASGEKQREMNEVLTARLGAEARTRERLEKELERLEMQEREGAKTMVILEETQKINVRLEEIVNTLKLESSEHQKLADQYAREFREARETGRAEVERTRTSMEADIEAVNNQVNVVRSELENEIAGLRTELENVRMDADTAKAQHELLLREKATAHRDALRKAGDVGDAALQEQRIRLEQHIFELQRRNEQAFDDVRQQHQRALDHALEDKQRSETYLNERLSLADAKLGHLQDKILLLEDKLETAKSAAQAAALAAQSATNPNPFVSHMPEKISPQALRESIIVLQEQLQEREGRIERLEQQLSEVDTEAPAKLKERDTEIGWLRELLGVRVDDLSDLVNTLTQPEFDREAVRDAAIRIRANLQMEQQEKERLMAGGQSFPALATLSNFASPKAVQLAAVIGNWRKGRNSLVSNLSKSSTVSRDRTPSKPTPSTQGFLSGLMTPPTSNTRRTPRVPRIRDSRVPSENSNCSTDEQTPRQKEKQAALPPETPPLMRKASYDQDAEDGDYSTNGFYDDDESTIDANIVQQPPEFEPFDGIMPSQS